MLGHITHKTDEWKRELQNQKSEEREAVISNETSEEFSDEGQEYLRLTDNWKN